MRTGFSVIGGLALLSLVGCGNGGSSTPDAGSYVPPMRPDGSPTPDYRRGCTGEGGVGGDGGCGEGGVVDPPEVDAGPPPPPCNQHTFELFDATASSVWVSGSFNGWATTPGEGILVLENDGSGLWTIETLVEPPGRHEYKFVIDGTTWIDDPENPIRVDDTLGGFNSVLFLCTTACGDLEAFDWRDTVMYFVMVDRFEDSDGVSDPVAGASDGDATTGPSGQYEGGDIQGVISRLPYLRDLGVTTIWLSAPYENRDTAGAAIDPSSDSHMYSGYHGYWPAPENIDYSAPSDPRPRPAVESRIGTSADLQSFVDMAHGTTGANGSGIKVLFDYVMNHVDLESGLYRAHDTWFAEESDRFRLCGPENLWDHPEWGVKCAFTSYLPPFDFGASTDARAWSVNDALWWAQEYGIDGYRLDAIKHVPFSWLTDLRSRLSAEVPEPAGDRFYLVGETFTYGNRDLIRSYVDPDTMLDGQFDFPLKAELCGAVFTEGGRMDTLASWMEGNDGFYGASSLMTTWIGNHDIPRAIHFASREIGNCTEGSNPGNGWDWRPGQPSGATAYERLSVAFAVLMTNPGIPLIYYGDEVGLAGGGDPDNRRMMPQDSALSADQRALRERVSALSNIRGENRALTRGTRSTISANQYTWVYRMSGTAAGCDEIADVIVAINKGDGSNSVDIPAGSYDNLLDGGMHSGGSVNLGARSYLILRER